MASSLSRMTASSSPHSRFSTKLPTQISLHIFTHYWTSKQFCCKISNTFSKSIYQVKKGLGIKEDFIRRNGPQLLSKACTHKKYSNSRSTCGALLLKSVNLNGGKVYYIHSKYIVTRVLNPRYKIFCYAQSFLKSVTIGVH